MTSTPTTDPGFARRAAGVVTAANETFRAATDLVHFVAAIPRFPGLDIGVPIALPCPAGGSFAASCTTPSGGPPQYAMTFSNCAALDDGRTFTIDGGIAATAMASGACGGDAPALDFTIDLLTFTLSGATRSSVVETSAMTGSLTLEEAPSACAPTEVAARLSGTLAASASGAGEPTSTVSASFAATHFAIVVDAYDANCAPVDSTTTVDGPVELSSGPANLALGFSDYKLDVSVGSTATAVAVGGTIEASCSGESVTVATAAAIELADATCPSAGTIDVDSAGGAARLTFPAGQVHIDIGADGVVDETYPTCRAPQLYFCPS